MFANLINLMFQVEPSSITEYIGYLCSGLAELLVTSLFSFLVKLDLGIYYEKVWSGLGNSLLDINLNPVA
jgi:hypothetical protein